MSQDLIDIDTIVACATPPGRGGVGIVRVSGPLAPQIARHILGKTPPPRYVHTGKFLDQNGEVLDQGVALYFPAPHSFTGEDVLELQGHGGPVVIDGIIQCAIVLGARLARPGEFSERAFLNGKIDLTQAEAIADLIDATSTQAAHYALRSLQGEFSRRIRELHDQITHLRVAVEAAIDFAAEELEFVSLPTLKQQLATILQLLYATQQSARQGVLLHEGATVVIAGKPNVGKSSLLNCLSGEDSAIVTPIAGTTRDVLRVPVKFGGGMVLQLIDTAGLHDSCDILEQEGVRRARAAIAQAQYILLMVDAMVDGHKTPQQLWKEHFGAIKFESMTSSFQRLIVIHNKIDLVAKSPRVTKIDGVSCVLVSVKQCQGIDLLRQLIQERVSYGQTAENGFSARRRHLAALDRVAEHLLQAQELIVTTAAWELIAEELREAQQDLGEISGAVTSEELLSLIFSEFCVGK